MILWILLGTFEAGNPVDYDRSDMVRSIRCDQDLFGRCEWILAEISSEA